MAAIRWTLAAAAPLGAALLAGCLTSTQASRLQTDLDEVKRQIFQVQQDTGASRSRLDEIDRKVAGAGAPASADQADLRASLRTLLDRIQALSDQLQDVKARMAGLSQEIQTLRAPSQRPGGSSPAATPGSGAGGDAVERAFNAAYADYTKGTYDLALMGFTDFLKAHTDHPLAADAQYWIGECLYSQRKYTEAADAFDRAVSEHPGSGKIPAALLKKGYAQIEAGQSSKAVATLQQLIEKEPNSEEARLAAERLKQLGLRGR